MNNGPSHVIPRVYTRCSSADLSLAADLLRECSAITGSEQAGEVASLLDLLAVVIKPIDKEENA